MSGGQYDGNTNLGENIENSEVGGYYPRSSVDAENRDSGPILQHELFLADQNNAMKNFMQGLMKPNQKAGAADRESLTASNLGGGGNNQNQSLAIEELTGEKQH